MKATRCYCRCSIGPTRPSAGWMPSSRRSPPHHFSSRLSSTERQKEGASECRKYTGSRAMLTEIAISSQYFEIQRSDARSQWIGLWRKLWVAGICLASGPISWAVSRERHFWSGPTYADHLEIASPWTRISKRSKSCRCPCSDARVSTVWKRYEGLDTVGRLSYGLCCFCSAPDQVAPRIS